MAQIQTIKRRIKSVTSTSQITKAMELVSASKMRRSTEALFQSRPYFASARDILEQLSQSVSEVNHPLLKVRPIMKQLMIIFASDRGLAGAFNSTISRLVLERLQQNQADDIATSCIVVGQRLSQFVSKIEGVNLIGAYPTWTSLPMSVDIRPISQTAIQGYSQEEYDSVTVVYTDFVSMLKQQAVVRTVLPFGIKDASRDALPEFVFEPSPQQVLAITLPRLIESQLFQAVLESNASEHAARMMAMKNASDNAEGLIDDLNLTYNSVRQSSITQELAEITSGAEAMQQRD